MTNQKKPEENTRELWLTSLPQSAFSMNQVSDDIAWWKYWIILFCLTSVTVAVALGIHLTVPRMRNLDIRSILEYTR